MVLCWIGLVGIVVVLCWVEVVETIAIGSEEGGNKMEVVDRSSKEDVEEVVESVRQEKVPAGNYYMNIHERISSYK